MSLYDYKASSELTNYGFYSLLMAAMRQADDINLMKIEMLWPDEVAEFKLRYNAGGGLLEGEKNEQT